jgi:hypothetical protein
MKPEPGLYRPDADIILQGISSNAVQSQAPVDDPIFAAHKTRDFWYLQNFLNAPNNTEPNDTSYMADSPLGVMGCAAQVWSLLSRRSRRKVYDS